MKNVCHNWESDDYPYIQFHPDASVGEEYRAWQGCPTIAATQKGRLFAGWYTGGAFEPCINNYNVLVMSEDRGENWSFPILTVHSDYEKRERNIDIQLWVTPENHLWVMWTVSPYYETSKPSSIKGFLEGQLWDYHREFPYTVVMVCKDPDADVLIWEKPRMLCCGFMRNKPIVTSGGRILAPAYDYRGAQYMLRCSEDNGESFYDIAVDGKPEVKVYDEITVCERRAGILRFLARTKCGYFAFSDSLDGGDTWTKAEEYEKGPSSRCHFGKLKNGKIVYVRNVSDEKRIGMKVCISEDDGETFPYEMILDDRADVSYPDFDEDEFGNIYIIYDRERDNRKKLNKETWVSEAAKEILLCKITVDDVMKNTLSEGSFLRKVVSKAEVDVVEL
jgi:hypothetical protein